MATTKPTFANLTGAILTAPRYNFSDIQVPPGKYVTGAFYAEENTLDGQGTGEFLYAILGFTDVSDGDDPVEADIVYDYTLADKSTFTFDAATDTTTVGTLAAKNVVVTALPASGSITVTPTGTTGATTYTYSLQACLADGTCNAAGEASTTTEGNATLSATNFNRLSWSAVAGAASYKVRRDVGGATTGVIWSGTALALNDTGLVGDGTAKPVAPMVGTIQASNYRTAANGNVAAGLGTLGSNTTGGNATAIGYRALGSNTTGNYNSANGSAALTLNTSGNYNSATGYAALGSNTTGSNNSATGAYTLTSNTSGNYNSATGYTALSSNTSGSGNSATGYSALYSNTSGTYNTASGYESGYNTGAVAATANAVTTSTYTTFLGHRAGLGSPTQRTNVTALGAGAYVDADNTVVLGDAAVTDILAGSTGLARVTQGETKIQTANGASWYHGSLSETITLSTVGTTTDSTANLLPANAIIEAVVARVTTAITTATDWQLGDATTPGRFTVANSTLAAGTTDVGLVHVDQTGAAGPRQTTAAKLRVTTTGTPGAGVIRVTVFYRQFTPPVS